MHIMHLQLSSERVNILKFPYKWNRDFGIEGNFHQLTPNIFVKITQIYVIWSKIAVLWLKYLLQIYFLSHAY